MQVTLQSTVRFGLLLTLAILVTAMGFGLSHAMAPMSQSDMRQVDGQDGIDLVPKIILNSGTTEGAGGTIFLGGGAGNSLNQSGNEGFLAMGDIGTDFTWSKLRLDVAASGNTGYINLSMNDSDAFTGTVHIDQIGVTKSGTLGSSSVPANLAGDVTVNGPINIDGTLKVFPN